MKNIFFYKTTIGELGIAEEDSEITNLYFSRDSVLEYINEEETEILKEAAKQLSFYLSGKVKEFDLPLAPIGTEFRKSVWSTLMDIPYGETNTYGEVAKKIGNKKASRAIGLANNKNPIPIFIPCHRVIGANGKMIGYLGGIEIKKYLLDLEKVNR